MAFSRRDFLRAAGLLAAGGVLADCAAITGPGDLNRALQEAVGSRHAVAVLVDLERREFVQPTDTLIAYRTPFGAHATVKPVTYWAGLQQKLIGPDTPYRCTGEHCSFG